MIVSHASGVALWSVSPDWNILTTIKWISMTFLLSWSPDNETCWLWWSPDCVCSATMRLKFTIFREMFRQLSDGLPWNLVQLFMIHMDSNDLSSSDFSYSAKSKSMFSLIKWNSSIVNINEMIWLKNHGPDGMNPTDFSDHLSFPLVPPRDWDLLFWVKCQQPLDGLPWNLVQTFTPPSGWIAIMWWSFNFIHQVKILICPIPWFMGIYLQN